MDLDYNPGQLNFCKTVAASVQPITCFYPKSVGKFPPQLKKSNLHINVESPPKDCVQAGPTTGIGPMSWHCTDTEPAHRLLQILSGRGGWERPTRFLAVLLFCYQKRQCSLVQSLMVTVCIGYAPRCNVQILHYFCIKQ